jgi:hypothetical protein
MIGVVIRARPPLEAPADARSELAAGPVVWRGVDNPRLNMVPGRFTARDPVLPYRTPGMASSLPVTHRLQRGSLGLSA